MIKGLRLNSIFSPRKPSSSGYGILDQFINQIMPMIQNQGPTAMDLHREKLAKADQQHDDMVRDEQNFLARRPAALPQIARASMEPEPPMRTVMQGVNPYQEATLGLRRQELESREGLAKDKQTEVERKNKATEEEKQARLKLLQDKEGKNDLSESEKLELQFLKDMEKIRTGQRFTTQRDETQQGNALARINATGKQAGARQEDQQKFTNERDEANFGRDIKKIENTFTNRKALEANKPVSSSQEKVAIQNRMNDFLRKNPEYAEFVTLDENGSPLIKEGTDPEITERINRALEAPGKDIKLPSDEKKTEPDKDAPPPGMKPGGKWITMKNGKRVYEEPDA